MTIIQLHAGFHARFGKTMISPADSQGSLPKTAARPYLDDISTEL
jgi:hypothetical protein